MNDDKPIEDYLRSFRPLPPAPLPALPLPALPLPQRRKPWRYVALGLAAALLMGVLLSQLRQSPAKPKLGKPELGKPELASAITIGSANQLLATSSSWNAVIGDAGFAFRSQPAQAAPPSRTALQFLSQEDLTK